MLKKSERLTKKEFDSYFKVGKRYHHPLLQLIHVPNDDFRGAAVVGKKIYKRAVDRNLYRRRIYNVLYKLKEQQTLKGVYILILKQPGKGSSFQELESAVVDLVGRIDNSG
mgnify:CR=1 FL=1